MYPPLLGTQYTDVLKSDHTRVPASWWPLPCLGVAIVLEYLILTRQPKWDGLYWSSLWPTFGGRRESPAKTRRSFDRAHRKMHSDLHEVIVVASVLQKVGRL